MCGKVIFSSLAMLVMIMMSIDGDAQSTKYVAPSSEKSANLKDVFLDYQLSTYQKPSNLKSSQSIETIELALSKSLNVVIELTEADILSDTYKINLADDSELVDMKDIMKPYRGYIKGQPENSIRISISGDQLYGHIEYEDKKYFIEPAKTFDKSLNKSLMVVYTADQVKKGHQASCGATASQAEEKRKKENLKQAGDCHITDLAIALDYSYWVLHDGTEGAINQSIAVMNMVAGSYENAFADDVRFEIVEHFVSNCDTCDPWIQSVNANDLLDDFTAWGPTGFSAAHDLGQFWTNRNLCSDDGSCSIAGLAWIGAVCGTYRYHILEDFTTSAWQLRVLVAHEMGHNFGANHDASGSQHIMAPSISSNTTSWSSTSVNAINTAIAGFTCFESCLNGSCTEILSMTTGNCTPGTISTYDLTVEIRHGGGGTATSFDLIVDGQSYTQSWSTSPQTVVLNGLTATGATGIAVSIVANDGSDTGCAASDSYDSPSSDCAFSVLENFDDCSMPAGWTKASTNIYSWNSGDPLVQYEWKFDDATRQFANYDNQGNATSPKTIDGTCMALMDDDIINHNLYTGDITLTSAAYNVASLDELHLKFDYNFHKFEDGGKGVNNSSFKVDVYDGSAWVNVLTDENDSCGWNDVWQAACTDYIDIDVTNYMNSAFSVRFIYSDGNDSKWTGMIALDNVEVSGSVSAGENLPGDCDDVVTVESTEGGIEPMYQARNLVNTSGSLMINEETMFAADSVIINSTFEVMPGTEFTIMNDGCQ